MLVIVSLSRLDNDRIEIRVTKPQHHLNPGRECSSQTEVQSVLLDFGISQEIVDSHLKLLAQMGENEQLKFPPMEVPRHQLLSNGFRF